MAKKTTPAIPPQVRKVLESAHKSALESLLHLRDAAAADGTFTHPSEVRALARAICDGSGSPGDADRLFRALVQSQHGLEYATHAYDCAELALYMNGAQ